MFDARMALDVESACRALLFGLGQAVLLGSVLAALTWTLLRVFQKRVSPALEMALWCVVLLRFVIPGGPGWSGSLANLCAAVVAEAPRAAADMEAPPAISRPAGLATGDGSAPVTGQLTAFRPGWATLSVAAYAAALLALGAQRTVSYRRFRAAYLALPEADADSLRTVEEICRALGRPNEEVFGDLGRLELVGRVRRMPGMRYVRVGAGP